MKIFVHSTVVENSSVMLYNPGTGGGKRETRPQAVATCYPEDGGEVILKAARGTDGFDQLLSLEAGKWYDLNLVEVA